MTEMNFASLSPTLLARKGGAKPAMRRQSMAVAGAVAHHAPFPHSVPVDALEDSLEDALEDLGWNDLGEESHTVEPADEAVDNDAGNADEKRYAPLDHHAKSTSAEEAPPAEVTPIRKAAPRLPRPRLAASGEAPSKDKSAPGGKRTAFTLRLDPERHLKLRMASTLAGRSAQALVTEAVDAMFADIPELDALVARVKSRPLKEG